MAAIFQVVAKHTCFHRNLHHAEVTIMVPVSEHETTGYTVAYTCQTEQGAWDKVLDHIENSAWFKEFQRQGVKLKVSGCTSCGIRRRLHAG